MRKPNNKAQTFIEYSLIIVCVIGALITMQHYIKRALQGGWRNAADQIGDQYDPKHASGGITTKMNKKIITEVESDQPVWINGRPGFATITTETIMEDKTERSGTESMGPYGATLWD